MSTFDELVQEFWTLSAKSDDKDAASRLIKVKELLGEEGARSAALKNFGTVRGTPVLVPRRPNKVPILDLLYELEDGQFVLVEAKYNTSQLGRVADRHVKLVRSSGKTTRLIPLTLKAQVEQLSPLWIKDRIDEIARHDAALAERLRKAVENGQLNILEIRSKLETDGTLSSVVTDRTQEFREWSGRRLTDAERRFAIREALSALYAKDSKARLKSAKDAAKKARSEANEAQRQADKVKRDIKRLEDDPGKQARIREKRRIELAGKRNELVDKQKIANDLKSKVEKADSAVKKAQELHQYNVDQVDNEKRARKAEQTQKRLERLKTAAAADAERSAAIADKALGDKAIGERMTKQRATRDAALGSRALAGDVAKDAAKAAAKSGFLFKSSRVVRQAGKWLFAVVDLTNPIFNLLLAVEIIDALVNWLNRDEIRDKEEWMRLSDFFFGEKKLVVSTYGITYATSIYETINHKVEQELGNDASERNFVSYLEKWQPGNWRGFVYAQIDAVLERQEENGDGAYAVKYYANKDPQVSFVEDPLGNKRRETSIRNVGAQDEANRATLGQPLPYSSPEYNIEVRISTLNVRITHPVPTLTPFDFIIAKCRVLIADIITFVAQYDDVIFSDMSVSDEVFGVAGQNTYWLKDHPFASPLKSEKVHRALQALLFVIGQLSEHAVKTNDFAKQSENENQGYFRRLNILREMNGKMKGYDRRALEEISAAVLNLVEADDPTLTALSEYADTIDQDLQRTHKECQKTNSPEYNYQGRKVD